MAKGRKGARQGAGLDEDVLQVPPASNDDADQTPDGGKREPLSNKEYDKALKETLAQPELRQKLLDAGITVAHMGGSEFKAFIKPQAALYRDIVTSSKITME